MKLKKLTTALILATLPATGVFAAALDRSGQSIAAFLQPGNYFEAGISVLDPDVSGTTLPALGNQNTGDMAGDYYFPSAALKLQLTDHFSFGLLYDQPFGADAEYTQSVAFTHPSQGNTSVEVDTQNISMIFGFQPTENWNIYGGGVYQTVKGNVHLRGAAYSVYGGYNGSTAAPATAIPAYDANIGEDSSAGWLAGFAYQIPEIALKASLTYRSEIKHDINIQETIVNPASIGLPTSIIAGYTDNSTEITTPQSVNLDFQTGIMTNTVAFANLRWVNWKDFSIRPDKFGQLATALTKAGQVPGKTNGFDLVAYSDDQINATVGVGRKLNDKWAGNVSVGWDSGAGNPVTTLGPTEGYWNVGLGMQYSPAANYFIAGGVKYFWLGDADAQSGAQFGTPATVAKFEDNTAWAYGLKIGYRF
ncbi:MULTISPECIES: outer membrane protein transport protein [Acinetobacter]|jgi:long-chain fatty acid transport protein|uniref:Transporter n=1 Tax=Acinetobacter bouvetii TaxID=202951 RepID=A0A4Q7AV66_9GAMM|nr:MULTISPECIES: outer membrane protein transport protein [Acinetobacter]RZG66178.1 transporter [Acinetobacter bouvetii]TCB74248.1 transporter [Acinetobacter sp. ANC 4177]